MPVEMLIRRVDKINLNSAAMNAQCSKRGDVIVVKEKPCDWGAREINNPEWILISVADLSLGDAEAFLQTEEPIAAKESQPELKKRIMGIDLAGLTLDIKANEKAHDKANWTFIFTHTSAHINNRKVIKPPAETVVV